MGEEGEGGGMGGEGEGGGREGERESLHGVNPFLSCPCYKLMGFFFHESFS